MKTEITIESIANAIATSWYIAHCSKTGDDWMRRWWYVYHGLDGAWNLINYSSEGVSDEGRELKDDISTLSAIASEHVMNGMGEIDVAA